MRLASGFLNQGWQGKRANFDDCAEFACLVAASRNELIIFPDEVYRTAFPTVPDKRADLYKGWFA